MEFKTIEKPPLGIIPEKLWKEQRLEDINNAIKRYIDANVTIQRQWIEERNKLLLEL